ncbi:MAG: dihydrolipoyl dehydrogenase [candidate division Zixibacteria bacterium]|nr:dihydrolipoyl dehydrogenase [candidate division Zixibacteria bacterium]
MAEKYKLVVIGSGPGGYVAAIRASQLGIKTAIVEKESIGGVCLNWGCIPSKTLLHVTELKRTVEASKRIGLMADNVTIDLDKLRQHKNATVKRLTGGVKLLLEKAGVDIYEGKASFISDKEIKVVNDAKTTNISSEYFIVSTGTSPFNLPMIPFDGEVVIGAKESVNIPRVPENMLIVGAGPIGVEMATVYNTLGAKVTIVELLDAVLPTLDSDISTASEKALKKQGINILLSSKVISSKRDGKNLNVQIETPKGSQEMTFDMALVAAGMKPNTAELDIEKAGVKLDTKGFVQVDKFMRSSKTNIFAIGDVAGGILLAHKASHEGITAVEAINGSAIGADWKAVPYAVFTDPEIAGIGMTEKEAKESGRKIKIGSFPYRAVGKAIATLASEGFAKIISDAETDELLGIHLFGPHSGDIIFTGTAMMEMDGTAEDLGHIMAVHPTISEALMEAALNVDKHAIHIVN